jgi:1-phosphofructokinase family hexose kinase
MILAVNVNAAIDWVFFIDRFIPGAHIRSSKVVLSVGGKGLDTALVLQTIGAPTQAITFIAGKNGETLAGLLASRHVNTEFLWVPGETRTANVIVETDLNRHTHVTTSGYAITRANCDSFLQKLETFAPNTTWAVMAGSLPKGAPADFYREIIHTLHTHGIKTLIDHHGSPLVSTLTEKPEIVKMNQEEFRVTFKVDGGRMEDWVEIGRAQMIKHDIRNLILTCGKEGILAFTPENIFHAGCSEVKEVNAAGAGDAVSAAVVYRLSLGEDWKQALTWAAAVSAAVVLTEGTAECDMQDVQFFYPKAWVKELS